MNGLTDLMLVPRSPELVDSDYYGGQHGQVGDGSGVEASGLFGTSSLISITALSIGLLYMVTTGCILLVYLILFLFNPLALLTDPFIYVSGFFFCCGLYSIYLGSQLRNRLLMDHRHLRNLALLYLLLIPAMLMIGGIPFYNVTVFFGWLILLWTLLQVVLVVQSGWAYARVRRGVPTKEVREEIAA